MSVTMIGAATSQFCLVKSQVSQIPHTEQIFYQGLLLVKAAKLMDVTNQVKYLSHEDQTFINNLQATKDGVVGDKFTLCNL